MSVWRAIRGPRLERAMKMQEVLLRTIAKKITWWQAAEVLGLSERQLRRLRQRYEQCGCDGLMDRRLGKPSMRRGPLVTVETVLGLCRDRYFDLNVAHFHEKLTAEHQLDLSYTWVRKASQGAGLLEEESTLTVMAVLKHVVETGGVFCTL